MKTGERIKRRRKELGISADTLAERIGVSRSTVFRYENGDIEKMPTDTLKPIADALHTTPYWLLGIEDSPEQKEKLSLKTESLLNTQELDFSKHLIAAYGDTPPNLTEAGMRDIANFIRFVEEQERKKNEKG